jgi:hypothetical protein
MLKACMTVEGTEAKEVREALEHMRDLRRDPQRFNAWADRVIEGWLKKELSSQRRLQASKRG